MNIMNLEQLTRVKELKELVTVSTKLLPLRGNIIYSKGSSPNHQTKDCKKGYSEMMVNWVWYFLV